MTGSNSIHRLAVFMSQTSLFFTFKTNWLVFLSHSGLFDPGQVRSLKLVKNHSNICLAHFPDLYREEVTRSPSGALHARQDPTCCEFLIYLCTRGFVWFFFLLQHLNWILTEFLTWVIKAAFFFFLLTCETSSVPVGPVMRHCHSGNRGDFKDFS